MDKAEGVARPLLSAFFGSALFVGLSPSSTSSCVAVEHSFSFHSIPLCECATVCGGWAFRSFLVFCSRD